jgi:hypothetical protein
MANPEKSGWITGGTATEEDQILVSKRLNALLPGGSHGVFTEIVQGTMISARVYDKDLHIDFYFFHNSTQFECRNNYCHFLSVDANPAVVHSYWGDTLEEVIDIAFTTVYPHFLDMCSKIAEVECILPKTTKTVWKCLVCGGQSESQIQTEVHCLAYHPYSPPVKSAGKI